MDGAEIAGSVGRAQLTGAGRNHLGRGSKDGFRQAGRAEATELADLEHVEVHFHQLKASIKSRCTMVLLENSTMSWRKSCAELGSLTRSGSKGLSKWKLPAIIRT